MNGRKTIKVIYLDREWQVIRGKWPNGTAALLLQNPETGGVIPASIQTSRLVGPSDEAYVPDERGLLKALENAGVVEATEVSGKWGSLTVWKCQVLRPELERAHSQVSDHARDRGREI